MRHSRLVISATLLLVSMIAASPPASAWAASTATPIASVSVIVGSGQGGQGTLIVTGTLPNSVTLPAKLTLPIPASSKPDWVGEIVGTDPSKDPTAKYVVDAGKKYDTITLEMTTSRTGQVEFTKALPVVDGSTLYAADLPIISRVGEATLSFQVPAGSKVASVSAGLALQQSASGTDIYSVTLSKPTIGKTLSASLTVPAPTGVAAAAEPLRSSSTGSAGDTISRVIAVVAAALVGFGVVTAVGFLQDRKMTQD